jgi:ActR/RegA family two-component response regulator
MSDIGSRLLFVDDEASIRMTLPPVLQKAGFDVRVAESVSDALFEINSKQFDVLISDLNIGEEGDGFLVTSAMRHVQPECITFILTGYPAFETALQAIHNHVDDYLVKPVDIESLTKTLNEKLRTRGTKLPFIGRATLATKQNGKAHASEPELTRFLNALIEQLELGLETPSADALRAAPEFGKKQAQANHDPSMLATQFRCLEQEVYRTVQNNMTGIDIPSLISDLRRFSAGLHSLMEGSLNAYRKSAQPAAGTKRAVRPKRRGAAR